MQQSQFTRLAILVAAGAFACADPISAPRNASTDGLSLAAASDEAPSYILVASAASLRPGLAADVARAGGEVTSSMDGIGVVVARSADPDFAAKAAKIYGIRDVSRDEVVQFVAPNVGGEIEADAAADVGAAAIGAVETFRAIQWAPDAVHAPEAWDAGNQGAGARVAILDGAVHSTHLDIAPALDVAHSASFVPGFAYNQDVGTFWHGTHVAGIVAAPANNIGTVGIAPKATIIGVKVLHSGSGAWSWIINGIYYAATPIAEGGAGADIINMSLGATFDRQGPNAAGLSVALARAATYAYQRGVTVIAAAGNNGTDLDHTNNQVFVPAQLPHVISVSALAPMGWAVPGTAFDLDRPASYTNFGQSAIDLAAPGGDSALPGNAICTKPRFPTGTVTQFCWVFDMVMAPCRGAPLSNSTYCWASGTSMASPAVAGVAALIVGKYGKLSPTDVRTRLEKSADDLGKPGNDDYYGAGRVNAFRATSQ